MDLILVGRKVCKTVVSKVFEQVEMKVFLLAGMLAAQMVFRSVEWRDEIMVVVLV